MNEIGHSVSENFCSAAHRQMRPEDDRCFPASAVTDGRIQLRHLLPRDPCPHGDMLGLLLHR